jgi:hypothetical protein
MPPDYEEKVSLENLALLLANNDDNNEKVMLYSKLGTLNFETVSNENDESKDRASSEHQSDEIFENVKSIRLSGEGESSEDK